VTGSMIYIIAAIGWLVAAFFVWCLLRVAARKP